MDPHKNYRVDNSYAGQEALQRVAILEDEVGELRKALHDLTKKLTAHLEPEPVDSVEP